MSPDPALRLAGAAPIPLPGLARSVQSARKGMLRLKRNGRALTGRPYEITHFTDLFIAADAFAPGGRLAVSRGTPNTAPVLAARH